MVLEIVSSSISFVMYFGWILIPDLIFELRIVFFLISRHVSFSYLR